jgi:hypothetical protein
MACPISALIAALERRFQTRGESWTILNATIPTAQLSAGLACGRQYIPSYTQLAERLANNRVEVCRRSTAGRRLRSCLRLLTPLLRMPRLRFSVGGDGGGEHVRRNGHVGTWAKKNGPVTAWPLPRYSSPRLSQNSYGVCWTSTSHSSFDRHKTRLTTYTKTKWQRLGINFHRA